MQKDKAGSLPIKGVGPERGECVVVAQGRGKQKDQPALCSMDCLTSNWFFFLIIFYPEGIKIPAPWLCSLLVIPSQKISPQGKALLSHPSASPFSHTQSLSNESEKFSSLTTFCKEKLQLSGPPTAPGPCCVQPHRKNTHSNQWEEEKEGYQGRKGKYGRVMSSLLGEYYTECRPGNITVLQVISLIEFSSFILPSTILLFLIKSHRARIFICHIDKHCCNITHGERTAANQPNKRHSNYWVRQQNQQISLKIRTKKGNIPA